MALRRGTTGTVREGLGRRDLQPHARPGIQSLAGANSPPKTMSGGQGTGEENWKSHF